MPYNIDFSTALHLTQDVERSLLIGNGFSRAICSSFSYSSLFDGHQKIKELFEILNISDLEQVLLNIDTTINVLQVYDSELSSQISRDIRALKESFPAVILANHPSSQNDIQTEIVEPFNNCHEFLRFFNGNVFTTNYDLLLYWAHLSQGDLFECESELNRFKHAPRRTDGFNNPNLLSWSAGNPQNTFYLHGAIHLYHQPGNSSIMNITKIRRPEGGSLIGKITEKMNSGQYPILIVEGDGDSKKEAICKSQYLEFSYERLKDTTGALFIYGFGFNPSDSHIQDQIVNSAFQKVLIGYFDSATLTRAQALEGRFRAAGKTVYYFNTESLNPWKHLLGE